MAIEYLPEYFMFSPKNFQDLWIEVVRSCSVVPLGDNLRTREIISDTTGGLCDT